MGAAVYMLIVSTVHGLMPVYAAEVFHVGPAGLGLMTSALGMGAALGTLVLASLGDLRRKGRVMLGALALTVVGALAFSASPALVVALPVLVLLNGGFDTFAAVRSAAIQAIAPDAMRGRASALNGMGTGMFTVGSLLLGAVAELYGARWATLLAASLMAACLAGINLRFRSVWRLE